MEERIAALEKEVVSLYAHQKVLDEMQKVTTANMRMLLDMYKELRDKVLPSSQKLMQVFDGVCGPRG